MAEENMGENMGQPTPGIKWGRIGLAALLVVVSGGIFGGLAYSYGKEKGKTEQLASATATSTATARTSSTATVGTSSTATTAATDETAGWKTYTSSDLKYSIKYPSDWVLDTQNINNGSLNLLTQERKRDVDAGKMVRVFDVHVKVYKKASELPNNESKDLSFEDWIKQEADNYGFVQRKSVVVDGVTGYQGTGSGESNGGYLIFVQKGDYIYNIETGETTTPTATEQKVIDSFKFL